MTVAATPPLILVADDSLVVRALVRRQLEEQGNAVVEAADGAAALEVCRRSPPDIILLDVEMPVLDGHGVMRALRENAETRDIPVVFLTARTSSSDVADGLRLGAHDYLRKPFEPAELLARVSATLRVKALQDELRQRNAELDHMTRTDSLTGLHNRRHLEERLAEMASSARRAGRDIGVLMIDVDHFKAVNDGFGHDNGDHVLRLVAGCLRDSVRVEDVVGRWGGEEFVVLTGAGGAAGVAALAVRICDVVRSARTRIDGTSLPGITVSVGYVFGTADVDTLVRCADAALYEAKRGGRDRAVAGILAGRFADVT